MAADGAEKWIANSKGKDAGSKVYPGARPKAYPILKKRSKAEFSMGEAEAMLK